MAFIPKVYFVSYTDNQGRKRKFGPFSERRIAEDVLRAIATALQLDPYRPSMMIEEMAINADFTFEHNGSTVAIEV
jgi:hypothetical protein